MQFWSERRLGIGLKQVPGSLSSFVKTNTALQCHLDVHWVLHNFVWPHFTTKTVPAVAMGILTVGLTWAPLFAIQTFPFN
jgi:hypothetical protein